MKRSDKLWEMLMVKEKTPCLINCENTFDSIKPVLLGRMHSMKQKANVSEYTCLNTENWCPQLNKRFIEYVIKNEKPVEILIGQEKGSPENTILNLFGNELCVLLVEILQLLESHYALVKRKSDNVNIYLMVPRTKLEIGDTFIDVTKIIELVNKIIYESEQQQGGKSIYKIKLIKYTKISRSSIKKLRAS